jgi:hypothetical protein
VTMKTTSLAGGFTPNQDSLPFIPASRRLVPTFRQIVWQAFRDEESCTESLSEWSEIEAIPGQSLAIEFAEERGFALPVGKGR